MVAKALRVQDAPVDADSAIFRQVCLDILSSASSRVGNKAQTTGVKEMLSQLIDRHCSLHC